MYRYRYEYGTWVLVLRTEYCLYTVYQYSVLSSTHKVRTGTYVPVPSIDSIIILTVRTVRVLSTVSLTCIYSTRVLVRTYRYVQVLYEYRYEQRCTRTACTSNLVIMYCIYRYCMGTPLVYVDYS